MIDFSLKKFSSLNKRSLILLIFIWLIALAALIAQLILMINTKGYTVPINIPKPSILFVPYVFDGSSTIFYVFTGVLFFSDILVVTLGLWFIIRRFKNRFFLMRYYPIYGILIFQIIIHFVLPIIIPANYAMSIILIFLIVVLSVSIK